MIARRSSLSFFHLALTTVLFFSFSMVIIAQQSGTNSITKYIDNFSKISVKEKKEKIFVHFDRPAYYSGDTVWFKSYLLLALNLQKDSLEKIMYVELRDRKDSLIIKRLYKVNNGLTNGIFCLPDTLVTGKYTFIAYTNWMRNDFGGNFFKHSIYVYNHEGNSITPNDTDTTILTAKQTGVKINDQAPDRSTEEQPHKFTLRFFPEGGTFVNNTTTIVAFEALDDKGNPVHAEGSVKDNLGNFVSFIKTFDSGKGFFMIRPDKNKSYKAYFNTPGNEKLTFDLPEIADFGYVLNVTNDFLNDSLLVKIQIRTPDLKDEVPFYLLGIQNGIVKLAARGNAGKKNVLMKCDKKTFQTGVVTFTLLDANMIPQSERLVFINNNDLLNINMSTNDTVFEKNQKINISVDVSDFKGDPVTGNFSLSVTDAGVIADSLYGKQNIASHLLLTSDIPDIKKNTDRFFMHDKRSHNFANLIMLTKGWRKFRWQKINKVPDLHPKYELEQHNWIRGTVRKYNNNAKPAPDVNITLMLKGGYKDYYKTKTDKQGKFIFSLLDFYDDVNVAIQTTNTSNQKKNYLLDINTNLTVFTNNNFHYSDELYLLRIKEQQLSLPLKTSGVNATNIILPTVNSLNSVLNFDDEIKFIEDTSSVLLDEVVVDAERIKTPEELMTNVYGSPGRVVNDKQIEAVMKQKPWLHTLFEIIQDIFPELSISININDIDNYEFFKRTSSSDSLVTEDLGLGYKNKSTPIIPNTYTLPKNLAELYLKDVAGRYIYIYVDGEFVASTNDRGWIDLMRYPYNISNLAYMDPSVVKSVELILDVKNKPDIKTDKNFIDYVRYRTNPAILSIYTKSGTGLYAENSAEGIQNMKMAGFVRERVFYSPVYSDTVPKPEEPDTRVTLYWNPEIELDSTGHAELLFYNSDFAKKIRIDVQGLSAKGMPGFKRNIFGRKTKPASEKNKNKIKNITSENKFTPGLWKSYKKEYQSGSTVSCIVIDNKGEPVPFSDILIKNTGFETTANLSGIFAFDKNSVADNDTVFISDPGKGFIAVSIADILSNNGIVNISSFKIIPESLSVKKLMSDILRVNRKNIKPQLSFKGAYIETIKLNGFIYSLADYSVNMQQYGKLRNDKPHISHVEKGRVFKTPNYRQMIKFKPLRPLIDEVVQLRDPLLDGLSFLDESQYKKSLGFELEGSAIFRGVKVYKINFKQLKNTIYNLYDGFLLVDANNLNVMYLYRKISETASEFQAGNMYFENDKHSEKMKFIEAEYRNSYRMENGINITKFQYSYVKFNAGGSLISYSREFHSYGAVSEGEKNRKRIPLNDLKHNTIMVKYATYKPSLWRTGTILPPDLFMMNQSKYLHQITYFENRSK